MSRSIKLSPKYGVNPTIPVCFWCGRERGEIVLMGRIGDGRKNEDFEAPKHMVLDFEPCDECKKGMERGFTVMEATGAPNANNHMEMHRGVYPTGRFVVLTRAAANRIFGGVADGPSKAFVDPETFTYLFE